MRPTQIPPHDRSRKLFSALLMTSAVLFGWHLCVYAQDRSDFPDGYDAMQAAPGTHSVIFENQFVRVLQVTLPPAGTTIPMHHHRWPSFFLSWDTGGKSPHIRYHRRDGSVRDNPSLDEPGHPGAWSVQWMKPEPMHAIEVLELPSSAVPAPGSPTDLRIELKCLP